MWSRVRLKIGWGDLAFALAAAVRGGDRNRLQRRLEAYWSAGDDAIACFSVRSAFDLLLQAMLADGRLAEGDEVLFSALNVKQMPRIVQRLGLVPVPVDLDLADMSPTPAALAAAVSPRAKVLVAAHLFGARIDMDRMAAFAQAHDLFLVEDCAQAYRGDAYRGHGGADAHLFSFGPIKTQTCLGGAVATVADAALLDRMRRIQADYPVQSNRAQAKRALKFALLKLLLSRPVFGAVAWFFGRKGKSYDDAVSDGVRDVAKQKTPKQLRRRCSAALLRLMTRRLRQDVTAEIGERIRLGRALGRRIGPAALEPAEQALDHDYWVFAAVVENPAACIAALRARGFDAASLPRSEAIAAPADRPHLAPVVAATALDRLIVLPCYPGMPLAAVEAEADILRDIAEAPIFPRAEAAE